MRAVTLLTIFVILCAANVGNAQQINVSEGNIYLDNILTFYNSSCIETSNYKYVFVASSNEEILKSYEGGLIVVYEFKELGNKSLLADITIL